MMLESEFQNKLVHKLIEQGCWVFNVHGSAYQKSGIPDLLVLHKYCKFFVELKCKAKVEPLQKLTIRQIKATSFPCYVARLSKHDEKTIRITDELEEDTMATCVLDNFLATIRELSRPSHLKAWLWFLGFVGIEPSQKSISDGHSLVGAILQGQEMVLEFVGDNEDLMKM